MKMAFEMDSKRFYDDYTWITPTSDGGSTDLAVDDVQRAYNQWRDKLARVVLQQVVI